MNDWNPVIAALAAAIPTLAIVLRNHWTLKEVAVNTNSRLSEALAEVVALKLTVAGLQGEVRALRLGLPAVKEGHDAA